MNEHKMQSFELINTNGLKLILSNYGARILDIKLPNPRKGEDSIVLGFDNLEGYIENTAYLGATVGRCANRIEKGTFTLNDKEYRLEVNNGENHLHGGIDALDSKIWETRKYETEEEYHVAFSYLSQNHENNYPGELKIEVCYHLHKTINRIAIDYTATSSEDTIINLCNHAYFNLSGNSNINCLGHELKIYADYYTPIKPNMIPTGDIDPVSNTVFNFSEFKAIGQDFNLKDSPQLQIGKGYDHNFVLNKNINKKFKIDTIDFEVPLSVEVFHKNTKRKLKLYSTQPGLQLYTGNYLASSSENPRYNFIDNAGFCLETQYFPNAINQENFEKPIFRKGEKYKHLVIFELEY